MRYAVYGALLYLAVILQTTLLQSFELLGVKPDLLCALVAALAIVSGPYAGAAVGGISGLMYDLLFMRPGFYAVQYMLIGLAGGVLARRIKFDRFFMPVLLCFTACAGKELLQLVYLYLLRVEINFPVALVKMLFGGAYTAALMIPVYLLIRALNSLPFMKAGQLLGGEDDGI